MRNARYGNRGCPRSPMATGAVRAMPQKTQQPALVLLGGIAAVMPLLVTTAGHFGLAGFVVATLAVMFLAALGSRVARDTVGSVRTEGDRQLSTGRTNNDEGEDGATG